MAKTYANYTIINISDGAPGETGATGYSLVGAKDYGLVQGSTWNAYETEGTSNSYSSLSSTSGWRVGDYLEVSFKRIDRYPYQTIRTLCKITGISGPSAVNATIVNVTKANDGATGADGVGSWTPIMTSEVVRVGNTFTKTKGQRDWSQSVYSKEGFATCFVSFKTGTLDSYEFMCGLDTNPTQNNNYDTIDYCWYPNFGSAAIYESGTNRGSFGSITTDTVMSIAYDGESVKYYLDGVLKYTSTAKPTSPLYMDSSLYDIGASIVDLTFGSLGAKGNGISSITYYYTTTTTQTEPGASSVTSTTIPPLSETNKFLWQKEVIAYTDGTSKTTVALIGVYGNKGEDGYTPQKGVDYFDGQDGTSVTVSSTEIKYQASSSGTTVPTGTWQNSPSASKGQYLWTRTIVNYSPSGSTTSYAVAYIGTDGQNGTSVTVSSTEVKYQESTSGTTTPTGTWVNSPSATKGKYLWTRTIVTYSNGSSTTSYSVSYNGSDGQNGTSVTVSSTEVKYQESTSGTTAPTGTWNASPSSTKGKYLWTRTVVTYSNGTSTTSYSVSYNGSDGANGTSVTISSTSVTYAVSTSGTTAPSSDWQPSVPTVDKGKFLWTKTVVTYSNGTSTTSYSTSYQGTNGKDGEDGDDGIGIASIAYYYKVTTTQTAPGASEVTATSIPPMSSTNRYLWQKEVINYTAGNPKTTVALIGVYGETGLNGTTFTPSVDASGNISWTNDGGKTNPTTQNIKGPKGDSEGTFKGALSSAPSSKVLNDYYVNTGDGITYEWNGSSWVQAATAKKCLDGLNGLIQGGYDLSSYGTRNTVTMFKNILAQEIYAQTIKAVNGFFDNIEVGGTSKLLGNVDNFAFKTFTEDATSSSITLDFLVNNDKFYQNYSEPTYYHRALNLSSFPLNFVPSRIRLDNDLIDSATIPVKTGSITVDGITYTATASTPMCIQYNLSEFRVMYASTASGPYSAIASYAPYNSNGYRTNEDNTKNWIATRSIFDSPKDALNGKQYYTAYTISACSLVIDADRLSGAYTRSLIPQPGAVTLGTPSRRFSSAHVDDLSVRTAVAYEALIGQLGVSHDRHDAYVKNLNATSASITDVWGRLHGTADSANSVSWSGIPDKPEKFEPSSHDHNDLYYTEDEVDNKLNRKSDTGHKHSASDITSGLAAVATSGSYNDLLNPPTIPDVSGKANKSGDTFTGDVIFNAPHRDSYYASNLCRHFSTNTPTEFVVKTKIKYVSGTHMPLIRIYGYAYGEQSPIELRVGFYIYNGNLGWAGAVSTGAWKPEVYLFKYTENSIDYVAVGFKGACYFCGFQVDAQVGASGSFNSNFSIDGWSTTHNGANTSVSLIPAVGTNNCVKVDYKTMKTDISGSAASATNATYTRNIKNSSGATTDCDNVVKSGRGVSCASKDGENAYVELEQFGGSTIKAYIGKVNEAFHANEATTATTATNADKLYIVNKGNVKCSEIVNGSHAKLVGTDANGTEVPVSVGSADTATEATKASQIKINDTSSFSALMALTSITIGTDGILHYRGYDANGDVVDKGTATVYACFS